MQKLCSQDIMEKHEQLKSVSLKNWSMDFSRMLLPFSQAALSSQCQFGFPTHAAALSPIHQGMQTMLEMDWSCLAEAGRELSSWKLAKCCKVPWGKALIHSLSFWTDCCHISIPPLWWKQCPMYRNCSGVYICVVLTCNLHLNNYGSPNVCPLYH